MNETEDEIINRLLGEILNASPASRSELIRDYEVFIKTVGTRRSSISLTWMTTQLPVNPDSTQGAPVYYGYETPKD